MKEYKHNAGALMLGIEFQVMSAIIVMLHNLQENESINIEGRFQDFEITKHDGRLIFGQAKSKKDPYLPSGREEVSAYDKSARDKLKETIKVFLDNRRELMGKGEKIEYVYVSNLQYPFGSIGGRKWEGFANHNKQNLTSQEKDTLYKSGYTDDLGEISFLTIEYDDDEDYETAMQTALKQVDKFLSELGIKTTLNDKFLDAMTALALHSGTDMRHVLKKNVFIATAIKLVLDYNDALYQQEFGDTEISSEELEERYDSIIKTFVEKYENFTKVISAFSKYKKGASFNERKRQFACDYAKVFIEENLTEIEKEYQYDLARYIILRIIGKQTHINKAYNRFVNYDSNY